MLLVGKLKWMCYVKFYVTPTEVLLCILHFIQWTCVACVPVSRCLVMRKWLGSKWWITCVLGGKMLRYGENNSSHDTCINMQSYIAIMVIVFIFHIYAKCIYTWGKSLAIVVVAWLVGMYHGIMIDWNNNSHFRFCW